MFQLPLDENPFAGADPCLLLADPNSGHPVLAPFAPSSTTTECSASRGTTLFVTGWSSECSDVEPAPFFGADEAEQRTCAGPSMPGSRSQSSRSTGGALQMHEVETGVMQAVLPDENVFGADAGTLIHSVGHGWVALGAAHAGAPRGRDPKRRDVSRREPGPSDGPVTTIIHVSR